MIDILSELSNQYIPVTECEKIDENTQISVADDAFHPILLGGDQLTRKRIETAKELRKNSTTPINQLKGIIPMCADWHAKRVFLEVSHITRLMYTCTYNAYIYTVHATVHCTIYN